MSHNVPYWAKILLNWEPKRHLKLESRVKRESNQDAEGYDQLGLVKDWGATTSVGPPFQHSSVLRGSNIFPEGKQDPHPLQLTKLWQATQFSIQIIKDAMNWKKKNIWFFPFSIKNTIWNPSFWSNPELCCCPCALLGHQGAGAKLWALFFYMQLDPRTPIPLYEKQMSAKLNHPMTPPGERCKQPQLTQLLPREAPFTNQRSQCAARPYPKMLWRTAFRHVYHQNPSKHNRLFKFTLD